VKTKHLENFDWILLLVTVSLIAIGLMNLYSIGYIPEKMMDTANQEESYYFYNRQVLWAVLGMAVLLGGALIPFRYFEAGAYLFYFLGLLMLLLLLFLPGAGDSGRWISIGSIRIQPSEFMKIATIFLLARYLSKKEHSPDSIRVISLSALIVAIPFILIIQQPDLGTAIVFPAILLAMLYWRGLDEGIMLLFITPVVNAFLTIYSKHSISEGNYPFSLLIFFIFILVIAYRRRHRIFQSAMLLGINLAVILAVPYLLGYLKPYQQRRVFAFLRPESDILGTGWQVYQSKVAVGSGGLAGKGFLKGTQKMFEFLPERHSDFVYSVLSEETGFLGSLVVLILFLILAYRILSIATRSKGRFASLAAIGICTYFIFHAAVNIGMTIGLAPVTGLPLPFLSYGGSSMLTSCFLIGIVLNFGMRFYEY